MSIGLVICGIIITYAVAVGITIAVINNSKLLARWFNSMQKNKKEILGGLVVFAPISLVLLLLVYIGYAAYCITEIIFFSDSYNGLGRR